MGCGIVFPLTKIALSWEIIGYRSLSITEDQASFAGDGASGVLVFWGRPTRIWPALATPYQRVGAQRQYRKTSFRLCVLPRVRTNSDDALATALPDATQAI